MRDSAIWMCNEAHAAKEHLKRVLGRIYQIKLKPFPVPCSTYTLILFFSFSHFLCYIVTLLREFELR